MTDCVSNVHISEHVNNDCNGGDVSCPMCLNEGQRNHTVNESSGNGRGCPMDWVCPNRAWTGHVGHVQSRRERAQWVPEVGQ